MSERLYYVVPTSRDRSGLRWPILPHDPRFATYWEAVQWIRRASASEPEIQYTIVEADETDQ